MATRNDEKRIGELERIGPDGTDVMVLGVDAPDFENLSRDQRLLCYFLYRAAIPGNRIAFDQSHRHALEIRSLLETVLHHSDGMEPTLRDEIHEYLKLVWIHHGPYHHYTHHKFTPRGLTPERLAEACAHATARGARFETRAGESIRDTLERLRPTIFDPDFEPLQTNQSEGTDIVAGSSVNYWDRGVTQAQLEALDPALRNKLNVRFALVDGAVVAEPYRIGGRYGAELEVISGYLRRALPYAETDRQRASIESLLEYYRTGDEDVFRRHCVEWLQSDSTVDYLNGFIEVYLDPRGAIGQFEGNVSYSAAAGLANRIADNALYFEGRMPWPDEFKRTEVERPVASVVNVLIETGDAGPVSPAAYNLPNYNDIRAEHGSKNVMLDNIENTWSRELLQMTVDAFFLPEYRDSVMRYARTVVRPVEVYLHEIVGHGSGRSAGDLDGDPRVLLGRAYSALEECRADLVALYHISDPKLVELGAYAADERDAVVQAAYAWYLQGWLSRWDRVEGLDVREAHDKGHHTIFSWLTGGGADGAKDYGAELVEVDGHAFVRITDSERVHAGLGDLLGRVQVIKSTADVDAAHDLFDRFGSRIDGRVKASVVERRKKLKTPKIKAFVFPHLVPVVRDGEVTDVELRHDEDLTAQQLRFGRLEMETDPAVD